MSGLTPHPAPRRRHEEISLVAPGQRRPVVESSPSLTRQQRLECEEQCDRTLCEALAALAKYNGSMDKNKWSPVGGRGQLKVYRQTQGTEGEAASVLLVGTGYLQGSLEEIQRGLYCDASSEFLGVEAVLSGQRVAGGAVLQAFETKGAETPFRFAGIKWCATQTGISTVANDGQAYNMHTFERMGVTLDSDNTEVAYHIVHSLEDHNDWPPDQRNSDFHPRSRLEPFALCYLYRRVSDDQVLCFIQGEYWGITRRDAAQDILMSRILMVSSAVECSNTKALTRMVNHSQAEPAVVSNACQRCTKIRPNRAEALHLCGICRKSVCGECGEEKSMCRINPATRRADTQIVCVVCLRRIDKSNAVVASSSHKVAKPTEQRHRKQPERYEEGKPSMRRIVSLPEPSPSYNYDELLRKRANSGSCTSSASSGMAYETETTATIEMPVILPDQSRDRSHSNEDLYLSGRNLASDLAQLQFERHLERHRQLDLETFHDGARRRLPKPSESSKTEKAAAVRADKQEGGHATKISGRRNEASVEEKKKSQREFYRDLYTEL